MPADDGGWWDCDGCQQSDEDPDCQSQRLRCSDLTQDWHRSLCSMLAKGICLGSDIHNRDVDNSTQVGGTFICFLEVCASLQPRRRLVTRNMIDWKVGNIN